MATNIGVWCCLAVFLLCVVGLQSSGAEVEDSFAPLIGFLQNISQTVTATTTQGPRYPMRQDNLTVEAKPFGPGWIVIQQRFDGSLNFNLWWSNYREGFGTIAEDREFWWGLEWVHQLTNGGNYELLIELKDKQGEYRYARYSEFVVGSEDEEYALKKLDGYSGTAGDVTKGDPTEVPIGMPFDTQDYHYRKTRNCAWWYKGGWWWNFCGSGLNAEWGVAAKWYPWKEEAVAYTRMLIRERQ